MPSFQFTVLCDSADEVARIAALIAASSASPNSASLSGIAPEVKGSFNAQRISPDDRPDSGVENSPQASGVVFGESDSAVAQSMSYHDFGKTNRTVEFGQQPAPSQVATPLPTPAPSTAAAGQAPTAPAAPSSTLATPPAPPAPAAPSALAAVAPNGTATPPPPAAVAGTELDKDGLPWDARIHSKSADGTRGKNKDGTWRQRRNLPDGVKETVEGELRQLVALNAGAAPVAASAAAPLPPAPPVAPSSINPLGPLLKKLAPLFASGRLTPQQADAAAQKHQLQSLAQLALTPNLVPVVEAEIDTMLAAAV